MQPDLCDGYKTNPIPSYNPLFMGASHGCSYRDKSSFNEEAFIIDTQMIIYVSEMSPVIEEEQSIQVWPGLAKGNSPRGKTLAECNVTLR